MAVNVSTELLKSGGNEVLNSFTSCEGPYQAVASASCDVPAFNSFKGKLQSKFSTFEEHSNIFSSKIRDCAICLEEIDSLIASGASGKQLVSVNNIGFGALGGITVAANMAAEFLDSKSDNLDESDADSVATDTDVDTDIAYYGANLQPKNNSGIAHRGYHSGGIKENTVEAFRNAGVNGFWGCETDVGFNNSGKIVCSHNSPDSNAPSFEDYLKICKEYGMTAVIDLKYYNTDGSDAKLSSAVVETVKEYGMLDSCVFQTNHEADVQNIRNTSDDARIWLLANEVNSSNMQMIVDNNVECVNLYAKLDLNVIKSRIADFNEKGIDSCVWGVLSENGKNSYMNAGATYIMSDNLLDVTPYQEGQKDFNNIAN